MRSSDMDRVWDQQELEISKVQEGGSENGWLEDCTMSSISSIHAESYRTAVEDEGTGEWYKATREGGL